MVGRLDGKIAIVTGAARGIGAAYALGFAREGAKVCVADILDPADIVAAIGRAGGTAVGAVADVADAGACAAMTARAVSAFGGLDILVNNAARFVDLPRRSFLDIEPAEWDSVMAVNVRGCFNCIRAAVPEMRRRGGGSVVNIASTTALLGIPYTLHYVTSKGAVIAMTRALARELGDDNIRVNAIAPGLTMSEAVAADTATFAPYAEAAMRRRALKRGQTPDDLVGAALFLAAGDSAFVTGQTIVVDGGDVTW